VAPVLLQPLTAPDIIEAISLTKDSGERSLQESIGVAPEMLSYFATRVQRLTGGFGRAVRWRYPVLGWTARHAAASAVFVHPYDAS
jgi:hypothetical protein